MDLVTLFDGVSAVETTVQPGGMTLPLRSTLLSLDDGALAIVSPVAIDDDLAARIESVGPVRHLIAPNRLHHLHLGSAAARWPSSKTHGAPGLAQKRADLRLDHELGTTRALPAEIEPILIEGAPALSEVVLLHRPSHTLVVTDLVFHVLEPQGLMTHVILFLVGARKRLAQSRAMRFMTKDRAAAAASIRQLLSLDFDRLVMAHGAVVREDAKARLEAALHWMLDAPAPRQLKAAPLL